MKYWLVGADLGYDNTDDYLENKYWADGYYSSGDNRNEAILREIKKGDRIAIKSSFTQKNNLPFENNNKFCSVLRVKARGVAQDDFSLVDKKVIVVWEHDFKPIDLYGVSYRKTIAELNNREHIGFIFEGKKQNIDEMKVSDLQNIYEGFNDMLENAKTILTDKKQIILYGPAGTGKTYNTKNIIVNHAFDNVDEDKIDERYKELQDQGRVEFVTFHQSFAYEDFIEGIKPNLNEEVEGNISYKVENGIFKELCEKAKENYINSFKSTQQVNHEQQIKQKFISFVNDSIENEREFSKTQKNKTFTIISIDSQSLVINSDDSKYNNHRIEIKLNDFYTALGYEEREKLSTSKEYALKIFKRTTQWQVDTYILNILKEFDKESKSFKDITETKEDNKLRNYYLIIDEINRGNISKIFGELITLLESSKRLGEDNELTTTLPYSKDEFGIPPNLYIIGTMNTSDKSIAHLDIALRRRFGFVEMLPKYDLKDGNGENLLDDSCAKLLEELNQRIEILLDKDHLIGHSFFCGISENESNLDNKISTIMQNEIVPLLEEYFYGDYEKIQLVLGSKNINKEVKKLGDYEKEIYKYWFDSESNLESFDIDLGDVKESKTKDD
ncbi:McrB family protein [Francisella sp. XLW-1]|uniref:McrB family protein n=1 Tax=Francisella sp. XLW-1 TaxID=2610887 RepID=UPI00123CC8E1|nr:AAA family ATPase [Francisella sp. XLW-1]